MSMKSFDDFCAKIINGEDIRQKEIFDERQTIQRTQITVQALAFFGIASSLNTLIMECGPQWCESYFGSSILLVGIAYIFWLIKNAKRGSLFGVNGTAAVKRTACLLVSEGTVIPLVNLLDKDDAFDNFFFNNGMISEKFVLMLFFVMSVIAGIISLKLAHDFDKSGS